MILNKFTVDSDKMESYFVKKEEVLKVRRRGDGRKLATLSKEIKIILRISSVSM